MFVIQILSSPHLMLADTGADDGFTLRDLVQTLQNIMRLDEIALTVVVQRMALFQLGDMRHPRRKVFLESTRKTKKILKAVSRIRDVRPCDLLYLADLACINIDVCDVFRIGRELRRITRDA